MRDISYFSRNNHTLLSMATQIIKVFFLILLIISCVNICEGKETKFYQVSVARVVDGDTFYAKYQDFPFRIRLYGVDAPERKDVLHNESIGEKATQNLALTLENKNICIEVIAFDKYNRAVSIIYLGNGETAQEKLLLSNSVHVSDKYCTLPICTYWKTLENK